MNEQTREEFEAWWIGEGNARGTEGGEEDACKIWNAAYVSMQKEIDSMQMEIDALQAEIAHLNHQHANDEAANRMLSDVCTRLQYQTTEISEAWERAKVIVHENEDAYLPQAAIEVMDKALALRSAE